VRVTDSRAGMLAEPGMLANIPRLTAYYTTRPDPSNSDEHGPTSTLQGLAAAAIGPARRPARLEMALEAPDVADVRRSAVATPRSRLFDAV